MLNADSDAASEIPRRWRIPADLHGAGQLFSWPGVRPTRYSPRGAGRCCFGRSVLALGGSASPLLRTVPGLLSLIRHLQDQCALVLFTGGYPVFVVCSAPVGQRTSRVTNRHIDFCCFFSSLGLSLLAAVSPSAAPFRAAQDVTSTHIVKERQPIFGCVQP